MSTVLRKSPNDSVNKDILSSSHLRLPTEIWVEIIKLTSLNDLFHLSLSCRWFYRSVWCGGRDNVIWRYYISELGIEKDYRFLRGHNGSTKYHNCLKDIVKFKESFALSDGESCYLALLCIKNLGVKFCAKIVEYPYSSGVMSNLFNCLVHPMALLQFEKSSLIFLDICLSQSFDLADICINIVGNSEYLMSKIYSMGSGMKNGTKILTKVFKFIDDEELNEFLAIEMLNIVLDNRVGNYDYKFYQVCSSRITKKIHNVEEFTTLIYKTWPGPHFNLGVKLLSSRDPSYSSNFLVHFFHFVPGVAIVPIEMPCVLRDILAHPDVCEMNLSYLYNIFCIDFGGHWFGSCECLITVGLTPYLKKFPHLGFVDQYKDQLNMIKMIVEVD